MYRFLKLHFVLITWATLLALFALCFLTGWSLSALNTRYEQRAEIYGGRYPSDARNQIERDCAPLNGAAQQACITEIVSDSQEAQRAERDLSAQESMADTSMWVLVVSMVGTLLASIGTVGLLVTLHLTRRSVQAADAALALSKTTSYHQLRAYVGVSATAMHNLMVGAHPIVEIKLKNFGTTPAYSLRTLLSCGFSDTPEPKRYPLNTTLGKGGSVLPPGAEVSLSFIRDTPLTAHEFQALRKKQAYFVSMTYAVYKDAYRRTRRTMVSVYAYDQTLTIGNGVPAFAERRNRMT